MAGDVPTPPRALITGATSGLGAEFARQFAAKGLDLVLVARDRVRLEATAHELASRYRVHTEVLAADLATRQGVEVVEARASNTARPIGVLVNNAGFGLREDFERNPVEVEQRLLDVMVTAPMRLAHAALGQMLPRRSGMIINVASVAGMTPRGTYGAAKAWLLSFSRWANLHYRPLGVTVTAVAPGFVRTDFHRRLGVRASRVPRLGWLSAERVVREAMRDAGEGKAVSVPSRRYKLVVAALRFLPDRWTAAGDLGD